jgi:anthranilate phosphoribosyltransferase
MDEVAGEGPTSVAQFSREGSRRWVLNPEDYGIRAPLDAVRGGDAATNAALIMATLGGERSPRADVVALNAALALVVAGVAESIPEGLSQARRSIAEGAALAALTALRGDAATEVGSHA